MEASDHKNLLNDFIAASICAGAHQFHIVSAGILKHMFRAVIVGFLIIPKIPLKLVGATGLVLKNHFGRGVIVVVEMAIRKRSLHRHRSCCHFCNLKNRCIAADLITHDEGNLVGTRGIINMVGTLIYGSFPVTKIPEIVNCTAKVFHLLIKAYRKRSFAIFDDDP